MQSGLILAGGASRRFGSPKAFAPFRGRPMIRWVADALRARCDELVTSVADSHQAERIRAILPDARLVVDERSGRGPIEGLTRGMRTARGDQILVAPCDAPLLRTSLYDLLLEHLPGHEAAVPRLEAFDPVRAVYLRSAVILALDRATETVPSPSALVDRLDVSFVGETRLRTADPHLASFLDVNSVDELKWAEGADFDP